MEDVGGFLDAAAAASPGDQEMKQLPAASAATGQLQQSNRQEDTTRHCSLSRCRVRLCPVHACLQVPRGLTWVLRRASTPADGLPVSYVAVVWPSAKASCISILQARYAHPAIRCAKGIKL